MSDPRLIRLRVELYTAAQTLKGDDQKEFTDLIREIAMVLDIVRIDPSQIVEDSDDMPDTTTDPRGDHRG